MAINKPWFDEDDYWNHEFGVSYRLAVGTIQKDLIFYVPNNDTEVSQYPVWVLKVAAEPVDPESYRYFETQEEALAAKVLFGV